MVFFLPAFLFFIIDDMIIRISITVTVTKAVATIVSGQGENLNIFCSSTVVGMLSLPVLVRFEQSDEVSVDTLCSIDRGVCYSVMIKLLLV